MTKPIFSIIYHHFRIANKLSMNEYVICDIIYHLSNNKNSTVSGWCFASKQHLGDMIGLSKRAIIDMLKRLLESDFLEINETNTQLLRTTKKWDEVYLTKNSQFGEVSSLPVHKSNDISLTDSLQIGEETSPTVQNLHQSAQNLHTKTDLDTENDRAEFAQSVKKLHTSGEETSPYIYSYKDIKHNVYNSLKEKENFEKKSEIVFIGAKEYKLSYLTTIEKFKEYSKLFKDFDNEILNTRMLEEVSISQYSKEDNVIMSRCFVYEASVKCGSPIKDNSQIEVLADSILKSIKPNANLSWSELSLMTDLSITKSLDHPLFDTQDEIEIPKMFNLHFFNLGVKRYLYFRKNLDSMIQDIKFDKKPYSRSM